jgi:arylsulfatase A-like enzyme
MSMDRREFLKLSAVIGASFVSPRLEILASAQSAGKAPRPNILVFLTDDHGQWAQHCTGNSELRTPNLDHLAATGVRMAQTFTTCPVCSPARASFWTGRMPSQHGIHDFINEPGPNLNHASLRGQTLLSELLKNAGYHTGLVGKWHCGSEREPHPGFDSWFSYWVSQYPHRGEMHFSDQGKLLVENGQQSPLLTNHAIEFLRQHQSDPATNSKPFFLYVGYVDTHSPHKDAPDDLVKSYESATFKDIPDETFAECHGVNHDPKAANPVRERSRLQNYYAAVSSIDREVGKIIDELKASGQFENTLIVYTGDHGLNTGHHGFWEKGASTTPQNFVDESIRIACTISWPAGGIAQNLVCNDIASHPDLWATLLQIAGATPDAQTAASINSPGRSYLPQLRGARVSDWRTAQISEYGNARMIRTTDYKLILRYPFKGKTYPNELYDLKADPRETKNCYGEATYQETIKQLTAEVDQFFEKYTVPGHSGIHLEGQLPSNASPPWDPKPKGEEH